MKHGRKALCLLLALTLLLGLLPGLEPFTVSAAEEIPIDEAHFPDAVFRNHLISNYDFDKNNHLSEHERECVLTLGFDQSALTSLQGIAYFPNLYYISCSFCNLTELNLTGCNSLEKVYCSYNQIKTVKLNTQLRVFHCSSNEITNLNLTQAPGLEQLYCSRNSLSSLNLSVVPELRTLSCQENNLGSLDLRYNPKLTALYALATGLTEIDVSQNPLLADLDCRCNSLTSLDLSHNPELTSLACGQNQLTELDLSCNPRLKELICVDNPLTELDLSKNPELRTLSCYCSQITKLDLRNNLILTDTLLRGTANTTNAEYDEYRKAYLYYNSCLIINKNTDLIYENTEPVYSLNVYAVSGGAAGGSVQLSTLFAQEGDTVTVTAEPNPGSRVLKATVQTVDNLPMDITGNLQFVMPAADANVLVYFAEAGADVHAISVVNIGNGQTSVVPLIAEQGKTISLYYLPDAGWKLGGITVTGDDGQAVELISPSAFVMPDTDVTVTATYEPSDGKQIFLDLGPGGTASLSATMAETGTEITVTVEPDHGHRVERVTWTPAGGEEQDITVTRRFIMPDANVTVKVRFAWINPFVDVSEEDWFYTPVLWAYYNEPQITAGTDATHFSPGNTVTRAEAMVFFWAANGHPEPQTTKSPFKDVKKSHWAFKAVMWAVENGITGGTDAEGKYFSPARTCTRSEILQFLYAAMGKPEYHIANPYSDVKNKHWYKDGAIWAYEYGLERGENGKFNATTPCTRASVVTYLYRYFTGDLLDE